MSGSNKSREQKLLEGGGTIVWATVIEAREKWQTETPGFGGMKMTSHMHLKLRVEPDGEPAFEASFGQALTDPVPIPGGTCKVVFDPADRSRIAVIDGTAAPPGLSREQAGGADNTSASASAPEPSTADQLTKLADLKDRGVLTDAEFQAQKAKLLAES